MTLFGPDESGLCFLEVEALLSLQKHVSSRLKIAYKKIQYKFEQALRNQKIKNFKSALCILKISIYICIPNREDVFKE
ncbi:hypothetical protein Pedsa_3779 [Pseudopedobacter saltans DSM 12145]|uniref:Uncharacterized protein n=1 Tax=Pseudopedobacter saltans (strain ATCC 51119 / DSM 12145 / JCM 21818 / CCUG 39354 / LMG 10337 / NBRC 100064 / NCIMB 13643) TaxID=762903 RepID=F0S735_PSESL|nr:hypothetical protein Pedsa_3779 [Pseudopedobacter saltans DSM 12145]